MCSPQEETWACRVPLLRCTRLNNTGGTVSVEQRTASFVADQQRAHNAREYDSALVQKAEEDALIVSSKVTSRDILTSCHTSDLPRILVNRTLNNVELCDPDRASVVPSA